MWITGIGLYHKGSVGYGGYVGFLIKTFDFSNHLLPEVQGGDQMTARLVIEEKMKYDFSEYV